MMEKGKRLRMVGIHSSEEFVVFYEEYILLKIEKDSRGESFIWRAGDGQISMVDVDIGKESGLFYGFTVVLSNQKRVGQSKAGLESAGNKQGIPIFEIPKNTIASDNDFNVAIVESGIGFSITYNLSSQSVTVVFDETSQLSHCVCSGPVVWGFDESDYLISISVVGNSSAVSHLLKEFEYLPV